MKKLSEVYKPLRKLEDAPFEDTRNIILESVGIAEYEFYTETVDKNIIKYIERSIFPQYKKNDKAHGVIHVRKVIRSAISLNDTLKLDLKANMIYAPASYHDLGKYISCNT